MLPKFFPDKFSPNYNVVLGLTKTKNHLNANLADLRLSDEMIELLKSGRIDTALLCELATYTDFVKLLADIQIYVEGIAATQIQNLNAWVDVARAEIMEKYQPWEHDKTRRCAASRPCARWRLFQQPFGTTADGVL